MNLILLISTVYSLSVASVLAESETNSSAALAQCGNLHHLEFHLIQNAHAQYSNDNCMLKCVVGENILSNDALNEGFSCPLNSDGVSMIFAVPKLTVVLYCTCRSVIMVNV